MITFYNLAGDTVAILDVQREVTPSELLASFDVEDCKYGRLVCKCFCEGTQLRRLLRSGWCSLEYRGSPLSVGTAFCNVSTEAEIRLLWQRQECKLGCCINSPQFLDNIFYGEPFPLLEKIYMFHTTISLVRPVFLPNGFETRSQEIHSRIVFCIGLLWLWTKLPKTA